MMTLKVATNQKSNLLIPILKKIHDKYGGNLGQTEMSCAYLALKSMLGGRHGKGIFW